MHLYRAHKLLGSERIVDTIYSIVRGGYEDRAEGRNGGDYKSHLKERISNLVPSRRDSVDCQLLLAVGIVFRIRPNLYRYA